jgi:pyruvate formate lyase activating enzyme
MTAVEPVRLAGLTLLTTVEWEGRLAAVLFLQGCPWRCRYCHNARLVATRQAGQLSWADALALLAERQGFIDAVVFSGGEPTFQPGLPEALQAVAGLGYEVALHTNGYSPTALDRALQTGAVSYVALDVKAPFTRYAQVTGVRGSGKGALESLNLLLATGLPHEVRTTWHSALLTPGDLLSLGRDLSRRGVQAYYLQPFRTEGCPDMPLILSPSTPVPQRVIRELSGLFPRFGVRGESG